MAISIPSHSSLMHGSRILVIGGAIAGLVLLTGPERAQASATLYVANNGMDNTDCGPVGKLPCRSISRAILHASAGDQIIVGPGLYGDINKDGIVNPSGNSGEETPVMIPDVSLPAGDANQVIIDITKQLTIVSRDGAGSTVINAGDEWISNYIAVRAAADGVVFGKRGKGFTIRNGALGVYVTGGVAGVTVRGTIVETCRQGFMVGTPGAGGTMLMAEGTVLKGNMAISNSMFGFYVGDESAVVSGNLAKSNLYVGFGLVGSASMLVTKNLALDNFSDGFRVGATADAAPTFSRNAAIGNWNAGVFVYGLGTVASAMTVAKNTLFGNGGGAGSTAPNCGLVIQNGGAQMLTVNADGNYWGAEGGPGNDPADTAGGGCTAGGPVTLNLVQSATKEIKVAPPVVK